MTVIDGWCAAQATAHAERGRERPGGAAPGDRVLQEHEDPVRTQQQAHRVITKERYKEYKKKERKKEKNSRI